MNNALTQLNPYIDATFYNGVYHPHVNARIEGTFNNVEKNAINFDSFRERASEIVDRMLSYKVSEAGGVEFLAPLPNAVIKKAVCAFVEHWFIRGYTMADIDASITMGGVSARQLMKLPKFRELTPFSALVSLQKSGMWDNKVIGISLEKELSDMGLKAGDIVTWADALAVFEAKDEGLNFNISADFTPLLGGQDVDRYALIAKTATKRVSFTALGGTDSFVKSDIEIEHDGNGNLIKGQVLVYSKDALTDTPNYYVKFVGDTVEVYVSIKDNTTSPIIAIANVFPDPTGEYGALGIIDTNTLLVPITKLSMLGNVTSLELEIPTTELNLARQAVGLTPLTKATLPVTDFTNELAIVVKAGENYITTINSGGSVFSKTLNTHLQDISNLIGTYASDDTTGKLTSSASIIRNLVILFDKIATNEGDIALHKAEIDQIILTLQKFNTSVVANTEQITNIDNRTSIIENSLSLVEKTWRGNIDLADNLDLTPLLDNEGNAFEYKQNDRIDVSILLKGENTGKNQIVRVGDAVDKIFTIPVGNGTSETIGVKILSGGSMNVRVVTGSRPVDDFQLYELTEEKRGAGVSTSYTKADSDSKYQTKTLAQTETDRVNHELDTKLVPADLDAYQFKNLTAFKGAAKTVIDALNENYDSAGTSQLLAGQAMVSAAAADTKATNNAKDIASLQTGGSVTKDYVDNGLALKVDKTGLDALLGAQVKYEKGRVLSYAERKTTGAFADRTLFSEHNLPTGYAILGGTGGTHTTGEVKSHSHSFDRRVAATGFFVSPGNGLEYLGATISSTTGNTGGTGNKAEGLKLVTYTYTALKDITFAEMGK